jgi:hypothetical protein
MLKSAYRWREDLKAIRTVVDMGFEDEEVK